MSGRRLRGAREAEVGTGLADALGLAPGSTLRSRCRRATELRLRVAGIVSSLDHDGRVAYVPARRAARRRPVRALADRRAADAVGEPRRESATALDGARGQPAPASGATARGAPLVAVLRTILRAIAIVDGLVCLYALIQACALTVQERRRTVAVLRACGGGSLAVGGCSLARRWRW